MTDQSTRSGIWNADPAFEKLIEQETFELREHARFHFYPNYRLPGNVDIRSIPSSEYRRILSVVRGALVERDIQSNNDAPVLVQLLDEQVFEDITRNCDDAVREYVRVRIEDTHELAAANEQQRNAMVRDTLSGVSPEPIELSTEQERAATEALDRYYEILFPDPLK